jgi:DNA modification methylase
MDLEITGFDTGEIDIVLSDHAEPPSARGDEDAVIAPAEYSVTQPGDIWQLGRHRVLCGDARDTDALSALFQGEVAALVLTDPPYNVPIQGHVGGRGQTKHAEFAFASGEMSDEEFEKFLSDAMSATLGHTCAGALLFLFMDWRHIEILLAAGRKLDLSLKNICVWNKTTPGQGSFYRSAHELIAVFTQRGAASTNNVQLGKFGRNRSNVWTYPGVNAFEARKGGDLSLHPTVKPVAMIAEAIKDASKRGEIVLDPFLGSGTTVLAAEKVGRQCYGVEYEPRYVDVTIRRWQQATGKDAVLLHRQSGSGDECSETGRSFDELCAEASPSGEAQK